MHKILKNFQNTLNTMRMKMFQSLKQGCLPKVMTISAQDKTIIKAAMALIWFSSNSNLCWNTNNPERTISVHSMKFSENLPKKYRIQPKLNWMISRNISRIQSIRHANQKQGTLEHDSLKRDNFEGLFTFDSL